MRLFTLIILSVHLDRYDISFDIKIKKGLACGWLVVTPPPPVTNSSSTPYKYVSSAKILRKYVTSLREYKPKPTFRKPNLFRIYFE